MFTRILIARRSAAAQRVSHTCRRLGIPTACVFEDPNENAQLDACDERYKVEMDSDHPSPAALTALAREHKIDAIHPGFVDDTDVATLARVLEAEDIPYVGLDPDAMETVRSRTAFHECVERAGARTVPTSDPVSGAMDAVRAAEELGFPVRLRGGGVDSVLHDDEDVMSAWEKLETTDKIVVEQWLPRSRTLDVLVAADSEGSVEALSDREITLQHGGHVLLEEAPAPALTFRIDGESIRNMMFDVAIRVAKELGTVGLIRVEMLLTAEGTLYPVGARLGLPSLHAVIERVTGLDLVELQLRLAAGEALPEAVQVLQPSGHAIGARVIATQADQRTLAPTELHFPSAPQRSVIIEANAAVDHPIPPDDGVVLARVTSFHPIRHQAALTLARILAGSRFAPHSTNCDLIRAVIDDEGFRAATFDSESIDKLLARQAG